MRAVMDWSAALLSGQEQALFRRLSVFAGSFTLETAEMICADREDEETRTGREDVPDHSFSPSSDLTISPSHIIDLLSNLIDKSLVTVVDEEGEGKARYRLLEPIRQ